jgi:hypothetical protein
MTPVAGWRPSGAAPSGRIRRFVASSPRQVPAEETPMFLRAVVSAFAFTLALGVGRAYGQSLAEKKYRKDQEAHFQEENIKPMQDQCGRIEVSIDWSKFKLEEIEAKGVSTYCYCSSAPDELRRLCADADSKAEVVKKVKKVVCKYGGPGKRSISLKKGTLEWTIDWDAANNDDYIHQYLMKNL